MIFFSKKKLTSILYFRFRYASQKIQTIYLQTTNELTICPSNQISEIFKLLLEHFCLRWPFALAAAAQIGVNFGEKRQKKLVLGRLQRKQKIGVHAIAILLNKAVDVVRHFIGKMTHNKAIGDTSTSNSTRSAEALMRTKFAHCFAKKAIIRTSWQKTLCGYFF